MGPRRFTLLAVTSVLVLTGCAVGTPDSPVPPPAPDGPGYARQTAELVVQVNEVH